jgi:hypothetical protein
MVSGIYLPSRSAILTEKHRPFESVHFTGELGGIAGAAFGLHGIRYGRPRFRRLLKSVFVVKQIGARLLHKVHRSTQRPGFRFLKPRRRVQPDNEHRGDIVQLHRGQPGGKTGCPYARFIRHGIQSREAVAEQALDRFLREGPQRQEPRVDVVQILAGIVLP